MVVLDIDYSLSGVLPRASAAATFIVICVVTGRRGKRRGNAGHGGREDLHVRRNHITLVVLVTVRIVVVLKGRIQYVVVQVP